MKKKLRVEEVYGKRKGNVFVGKWKDKREILFISTKHGLQMSETGQFNRSRNPVQKPDAIIYYNKDKVGIDLSDQISSYTSPLRKTIR